MSGLPRRFDYYRGLNGAFLQPIADANIGDSAPLGWPNVDMSGNCLAADQIGLTAGQADLIASSVRKWQVSGSVTYTFTGDPPPPPMVVTFDSNAFTKMLWIGNPLYEVTAPNESGIASGAYWACMDWDDPVNPGVAAGLCVPCGLANGSFAGDFGLGVGCLGLFRQNDGSGKPLYYIGSNQGFFALNGAVLLADTTSAFGIADSGVDFTILGIRRKLFCFSAPTGVSISGTVTVTAAEGGWWGYGGAVDPATGQPY